VVFSIAQVETFEEVCKWKADIDSKVTIGEDGRPIPVVLLANKCDLDTTEGGFSQNNKAKMDAFCKEYGFAGWFVVDLAPLCRVTHLHCAVCVCLLALVLFNFVCLHAVCLPIGVGCLSR
jgi:Ras family